MITALEKIRQLVSGKDSVKGSEIEKILDDKSLSKEEILAIQNFLVECNIEVESDYDDYDDEKEISEDIVDADDVIPLTEEMIEEPEEEDITENNPVAGYAIEFLTNNDINLDEESKKFFIKEICSVYGDEEETIKGIVEELEEQELLETIDRKSINTLVKKVRNENYKRFEAGKNVNDSVRMYLADIGKIPLYTPAEERKMALKIKNQRELVEKIESGEIENSSYSLMNEEDKLRELEKEFASHNLRLVVSIARRFCTSQDNFLDLIQEGNIGLQKAVSKYDVDTGYKFSTYATWWIKQAVTRSIADSSRTIRVPVHVHEKIGKLRKAERELTAILSRTPTNEELAEALNETPEKIDEIKRYTIPPVSIDSPINTQEGDQDSLLVDFIPDNSLNPEEETMEKELQGQVSKLLKSIDDKRARRVVMFRFGLFNNNFSEEELEAARLRYVIASLPIGMIKTLPEPIMEDVIRNTTTRNIEVLKTFIIDNLPENLKNKELIEMYPEYINKLTSSERIHLYRKLYGDKIISEEPDKSKVDYKVKLFFQRTNLAELRRKCIEKLTNEEKALILNGMSSDEKTHYITGMDTSELSEELKFAKKVIDIRTGNYKHTTQKDYGKDETSEERREMKNIIYNDSYNDAKDDERYADACLVARTYAKVFRKAVNPSTLLYVKDNFRNRYFNVFRKFQQGNVCTLEDVGILEDVTRERIRQIEAKTFRKLRIKEKNKSLSLKGYITTD